VLAHAVEQIVGEGNQGQEAAEPWTAPHRTSPGPWQRSPEIIHAIGWKGTALVLWHDCQIEKAENQERSRLEKMFAAVAPILPLDELQSKTAEDAEELRRGVRNGEHHSYFYLPKTSVGEFSMRDSYVNLRYIWSVRQVTLLPARKLSLAPEMLPSLYSTLFVFFTRYRLDMDPLCPKCGVSVPLVPALDTDDDGGPF
jgi:hypothetical protein